MRLSAVTVDRLPSAVVRPDYDRAAQRAGIVHLGIGAFHRAHQAVYTDAAMTGGDRDWAITGVSLRSPVVRDAIGPQDGLYTVTERSADGARSSLIGAVRDVIVAPEAPDAVARALASPDTRIVTLTVTEKGYHRLPDGALDVAVMERAEGTIYHHLARALADRRAAGLPGLTLLSCDNLADNGGALSAALTNWLNRIDPALAVWFAAECKCPASMVDRIVPAPSPNDLADIAQILNMQDTGAVVTEPFRQWVIEDRFAGPRPRWELGGAAFVADVAPYEAAKLRMLNGAHSALAYLGLLAGHAHVHEAIADPAIRTVIEQLIRDEAAASLDPAPGQGLSAYAAALLARFANPALPHRLAQIATDGSQKIVQRWLEPLAVNQARGRTCPATLRALAAWIVHVRGDGEPVADPMANKLAVIWAGAGREGIIDALFGQHGLYAAPWHPNDEDKSILTRALHALG
ncbi:mannitol dehydrogenase family protein [Sphingomonas sp. SUN019]|uniref:mannitol dehydrogenase family protein n=1 Tax=Sphingomonas sp. SUN019 TaxID=2937788 RepID=UPI002164DBB6|nr:mannitol dehydrogenase family protein [Sphingomonas sp. SUN019]UVO49693.1 mannitol dehydrogenase family protein [Sphingomonas sp. SUN019]